MEIIGVDGVRYKENRSEVRPYVDPFENVK